ncbi:MAG: FkbM family methyltransferase [Clostridia bacterium]|nr:FkbM family methyltransferase [Clostridia bacterium]
MQKHKKKLFFPTHDLPDLWHYLKHAADSGKKIVMYGMGNGADKILAVCEKKGIDISDFFASDGFVRGHSFHGKVVLSYSDVKAKYGTDGMIILLSFATSRPEVLQNIERIAAECELYAPDVPVFGDTLFDGDFYRKKLKKIEDARSLLNDNISKKVFDSIIDFKLTGRIDILRDAENDTDQALLQILGCEGFARAADLGAYNGDSVKKLLSLAPNVTDVIAFEPDSRNFRKLCEYAKSVEKAHIHTVNAGAWSEAGMLEFDDSGNRNANLAQNTSSILQNGAKKMKTRETVVDTLDRVATELGLFDLDYVKYDVEGSEKEAILGSASIIQRRAPALLVSLYHRSEDIFELPLMLAKMQPRYKFYLRRAAGIPAWDINLYAIAEFDN